MTACFDCPRQCGADREKTAGVCGMGKTVVLARAALHMWEEPCISGTNGSGAVFFVGCPLRCVYCQNAEIAAGHGGVPVTEERLCEIFFELAEKGAHNINLVTPTHYVSACVRALTRAKKEGLRIPIVYNCGGYESVEALKRLSGLVDIYLPDFKYMDPALAAKYSRAPDYPETAKRAIDEMVRQQGEIVFDDKGILQRGVLIRHMLLPGCLENSKRVMDYLWHRYGYEVWFSVMSQYTPLAHVSAYPELMRRVTGEEYDELVDFCCDLGMENAFTQEGVSAEESFIPSFDGEGVK